MWWARSCRSTVAILPAELAPTIDGADAVLVFADLQPALVARSRTASGEAIEAGAAALAQAAVIFGWPMLFSVVAVDGEPPAHLPPLADHAANGNSFTRSCARPFGDDAFVRALKETGRRTLIIAGYSAEAVIQYLALDGIANAYRVVVALEASGARSARTEAAALRRIERAGATVTSVADILQSAEPDMASRRGGETFAVVHAFMGKDY